MRRVTDRSRRMPRNVLRNAGTQKNAYNSKDQRRQELGSHHLLCHFQYEGSLSVLLYRLEKIDHAKILGTCRETKSFKQGMSEDLSSIYLPSRTAGSFHVSAKIILQSELDGRKNIQKILVFVGRYLNLKSVQLL